MRVSLLLIPLLVVASGCAIRSSVQIANADRAVQRVTEAGIAESSRYDRVLATRYVAKAREEAARSRHRSAVALARTALDHALAIQAEPLQGAPASPEAAPAPAEPTWDSLDDPEPTP